MKLSRTSLAVHGALRAVGEEYHRKKIEEARGKARDKAERKEALFQLTQPGTAFYSPGEVIMRYNRGMNEELAVKGVYGQ
jgi:hypothetical protein